MNFFKISFAAFISCMPVAAFVATSALAAPVASPITKALVANVKTNLDFLDQSAALASTRARKADMRTFARNERSDASEMTASLQAALPVSADAEVAMLAPRDADALMTGRSVAVDVPPGGPAQAANGRAPMGEADLAQLGKLSGKAFDDAFWLKTLDALSQLRADYQAYLDDGDDPALVALAKRQLPAVERRLAALAKV